MPNVKFRDWECHVERTQYHNGRTALILVDAKDRDRHVAVATVNLPEQPLDRGQVFIKDYSENAGMLAALEQAGVVKDTGESVQSGFARIPKATLLPYEQDRAAYQSLVREASQRPYVVSSKTRER